MAEVARDTGFSTAEVIDEDLGRSGSGQVAQPGFQRLVAEVCAGSVGAVYRIEASRLARNGRDWHYLIDLCALTGTLVVDPEGVYDPHLMNDRLLLGLKGTMSKYALNLLRQRGLAARDAKAGRGELRFTLPPGYCWSEDARIEMDPDQRVQRVIHLIFAKLGKLGSGRSVFLWPRAADIHLPVVQRNGALRKMTWCKPAYHSVCRCCTARSMQVPMPLDQPGTGHGWWMGRPARPAVTTGRLRAGTCSSRIATRDISTGAPTMRTAVCLRRPRICRSGLPANPGVAVRHGPQRALWPDDAGVLQDGRRCPRQTTAGQAADRRSRADIDAKTNEFVQLLHWIGGCHTEVRLARRKTGRFPPGRALHIGVGDWRMHRQCRLPV